MTLALFLTLALVVIASVTVVLTASAATRRELAIRGETPETVRARAEARRRLRSGLPDAFPCPGAFRLASSHGLNLSRVQEVHRCAARSVRLSEMPPSVQSVLRAAYDEGRALGHDLMAFITKNAPLGAAEGVFFALVDDAAAIRDVRVFIGQLESRQ